jgi:putative protease
VNSNTKKPEILAPAGDAEKLRFSVLFGADAVYLGLQAFSMRTSTQNFTGEELKAAVNFAHEHKVKVYLALNTLPRNADLGSLPGCVELAKEAGIDAFIVADLGVFSFIKQHTNGIDIHVSTQMGIVNSAAANELFKMGANRIILARELSMEEIKEIRKKTPNELELEVFVHGAMCMAFSGRCLLSTFMTGRDANRGECAQPCRWAYLVEQTRPEQVFELQETRSGSYIFNSRDLCMINHIPELIDAGINSFKIEGRAKSFYYCAVITNAYRQAVDLFAHNPVNFNLPEPIHNEVYKVSHREYSTGFYFGTPGQTIKNGGYVREYDVVATVESCNGSVVNCIQRNKFTAPTNLELLEPGALPLQLRIERLFDEAGDELNSVPHAMMKFSFRTDIQPKAGSILRKKIDPSAPQLQT